MIRPPEMSSPEPMPWWHELKWIAALPIIVPVVIVTAVWQWWEDRDEAKRFAR